VDQIWGDVFWDTVYIIIHHISSTKHENRTRKTQHTFSCVKSKWYVALSELNKSLLERVYDGLCDALLDGDHISLSTFQHSSQLLSHVVAAEIRHMHTTLHKLCCCQFSVLQLLQVLSSLYVVVINVCVVAQWLGCQSLARGLSLPASDLWLTGDHFVGKLSTVGQPTRPTQPSIPPGSVNQYQYSSSNPCIYTDHGRGDF